MISKTAIKLSNEQKDWKNINWLISKIIFSENSTEEIFNCDFDGCDKSFKIKLSLQQHQKIHTGINLKCVCPQCKFVTFYKHQINRHTLIHKKKKIFKCDYSVCHRSFNTNNELINHSRERPNFYYFKECVKAFKVKIKLENHMKRHLGIKRFEFNECDMKFVELNGLKQHIFSFHKV